MDSMKKTFRPEFLNRIDEIIVFQQLTKEEIRRIVDIMSADLQERIKSQGMELRITDECKDYIAKDGYNPTYGARPLRRSIQRLLEDALAEQVLQGTFKDGDIIETVLDGETFHFEKGGTVKQPPKTESKGSDERSESKLAEDKEKAAAAKANDDKSGEEKAPAPAKS
jgi:ATP-dependent Clp protease ATP-binding subunit ClpC